MRDDTQFRIDNDNKLIAYWKTDRPPWEWPSGEQARDMLNLAILNELRALNAAMKEKQ